MRTQVRHRLKRARQVFAGREPFHGARDFVITNKILHGGRPLREDAQRLKPSEMDAIWDVITRCWDKDVRTRLALREIDSILASFC
jgi:hypothetical protein